MGFIKKRRHLELAVLKVEHGEVSFRIVKQTHFGDSFTGKKSYPNIFFASNGIELISEIFIHENDKNKFFVPGEKLNSRNQREFTVTAEQFARISEAIAQYNAANGDDDSELYGKKFWFIEETGEISSDIYRDSRKQIDLIYFGNYFRTRRQAEEARSRIVEFLNGTRSRSLFFLWRKWAGKFRSFE